MTKFSHIFSNTHYLSNVSSVKIIITYCFLTFFYDILILARFLHKQKNSDSNIKEDTKSIILTKNIDFLVHVTEEYLYIILTYTEVDKGI